MSMMKPMLEWINQSKITKKMYFFYEDRVLDLTDFMNIHPGGQKALKNYVSKDITDILFSVYPHSTQSTLQVLFRYQIGKIPQKDFNQKTRNDKSPLKNNHGQESQGKQKKKVGFNKKFVYTEGQGQNMKNSGIKNNLKYQKQNQVSPSSMKKKQILKQQKHGNKKYQVSIKTISERSLEQSVKTVIKKGKSKSKEKSRNKSKQQQFCSFTNLDEIDENKPELKIPIMSIWSTKR